MVSITLPTYNESEALPILIEKIRKNMGNIPYEIIIVDDGSTDDTIKKAHSFAKRGYPITVIERGEKKGIASAILDGFNKSKYPILCAMDADLQHDPKYLPKMLKEIMDGADMVIGSRYTRGGKIENWSVDRKITSKIALTLTRPLTNIADPLGQFFMARKIVIQNIEFRKIGHRISLEILVKSPKINVVEIPITFGGRTKGLSKQDLGSIIRDIRLLVHLYCYRIRELFWKK